MFKKAKRCNFRRRNDSEDEEKEENQQSGGPGAEAKPSEANVTSCAAPGVNVLNNHGNGFQSGLVKSNREKEKKKKENREEPKASLLSFQDDEGNVNVTIKSSW